MTTPGPAFHHTDDPAEALALVGDLLAREPLTSTVVATTLRRDLARREAGEPAPAGRPYWFAVALEDGVPVGVVMRAAERPPHPLYVLPVPEEHARELARLLHDRGEEVPAVNGTPPAVHHLAEEYAARAGRQVRVAMRTRLLRLGTLVPPPRAPGALRPVTADEVDEATGWLTDFVRHVDLQAGRLGRHVAPFDPEETASRVREGRLWWWDTDDEGPVHLVGANVPADDVVRLAPVYTPEQHRGRGYAANAVAALAARFRDDGWQVCLFVDRDNPHSSRLYGGLGFEAVTDTVDLLLDS